MTAAEAAAVLTGPVFITEGDRETFRATRAKVERLAVTPSKSLDEVDGALHGAAARSGAPPGAALHSES